jgi:hypothetical protein
MYGSGEIRDAACMADRSCFQDSWLLLPERAGTITSGADCQDRTESGHSRSVESDPAFSTRLVVDRRVCRTAEWVGTRTP